MKIELLLPTKGHFFSKEDIENERVFSEKVLPKLESFISFVESHEILDTYRHKRIKTFPLLAKAYSKSELEPFQFIISMN